MGEKWVGTQSGTPSTAGWGQHSVVEEWSSTDDLVAAVQLLTTERGVASWLGEPLRFDQRRGASLKFQDDQGEFGASYSLIDVPKRFVLNTERFGEISILLQELRTGSSWQVSINRLVQPSENAEMVDELTKQLIARLKDVSHALA